MKILNYTPGMEITPPCLILNMPNEVYHSLPGISKSGLDRIAISPAHYRYREPSEPSRSMVIGSAIHAAILQPDVFAREYLQLRDVKARTASEYKAAVKDWPNGADFVLTGPESDHIAGMQAAVGSDPNCTDALDGFGYREASLFVPDPVTGITVRVRFDFLPTDPGRPVIDLKKTRDCRPDAFMRAIASYRYHVQAALYLDAWEWATGGQRDFQFLAIEETIPHARKLYTMGPESLALGRKLYRAEINTFAACHKAEYWPCHDSAPELIELPDWVLGGQEITVDEEIEA